MKSINLKRFFGFYNQKLSFMKIGAYCHNPIKHLKNSLDTHDDLVCILTLIQRAVFLVRFIDLLVSKEGDWNYKLILVGILFLFSRQIAQLLLFVNGRVIHLLMRILFHRKDLLAAEISHTYSSIALDPTYFLIYFAISLDSVVYSAIKPFHLLMITMFLRLLLKAINISVIYKIKFYLIAIATLLFSALVFSIYPTFYVPVFLLVRFSPKIIQDDIDLSVLDYYPIDIDSSCDGSLLLKKLGPLPDSEAVIVDSIFKKRDSITTLDIPFMDKRLKVLEPFWKVTWFDKRNLPEFDWDSTKRELIIPFSNRLIPEEDCSDSLNFLIAPEVFPPLFKYISLDLIKFNLLLSTNKKNQPLND